MADRYGIASRRNVRNDMKTAVEALQSARQALRLVLDDSPNLVPGPVLVDLDIVIERAEKLGVSLAQIL